MRTHPVSITGCLQPIRSTAGEHCHQSNSYWSQWRKTPQCRMNRTLLFWQSTSTLLRSVNSLFSHWSSHMNHTSSCQLLQDTHSQFEAGKDGFLWSYNHDLWVISITFEALQVHAMSNLVLQTLLKSPNVLSGFSIKNFWVLLDLLEELQRVVSRRQHLSHLFTQTCSCQCRLPKIQFFSDQ